MSGFTAGCEQRALADDEQLAARTAHLHDTAFSTCGEKIAMERGERFGEHRRTVELLVEQDTSVDGAPR